VGVVRGYLFFDFVFVVVSLGCFGLGRDIVSGYFRLGVLVSGGSCLFGIFVLVCYFRLGVSVVTCISRCFCCRITLYCRYCTVRLCCHLTLLVSLCCHSHYSLCLSLSLSLSHTLSLSHSVSLSPGASAATTQITLSESLCCYYSDYSLRKSLLSLHRLPLAETIFPQIHVSNIQLFFFNLFPNGWNPYIYIYIHVTYLPFGDRDIGRGVGTAAGQTRGTGTLQVLYN
jgi:hypothetical protein